MASRRNTALKYYVSGRLAKDLHGLTDLAGGVLDAFDAAVIRARVGLARRAEPAAKRNVRAVYGVKAGALAKKFRIDQGTRGKRDSSELISIWASSRGISLIEFNGVWRGRKSAGAVAQIVRGQSKTYGSAFIANVGWRGSSGGAVKADTASRGIYVRSFNRSSGRRHGRGPLRLLRGPSPFEMLSGIDYEASRKVRDATLSELTTFYLAELRRQFKLKSNRP